MLKSYYLFETDSHAWLKVPTKDINQLNLLKKISNCSFRHNTSVFLEEDLDLPLFFKTAKSFGWKVQITDEIHIKDVSILRELP
ncbi:hypothetical protein BALOs_0700 [Halobacteriovorax sp. BALOs_7]|uniref:hypothetical protein n=1 Tax=Halobacteriovorax sp. BALOs_7 TaxID=2109558 RepID=UPI000EA0476F|nr:hypothetical protein [Halobacteriovorax sp. BALOs_7]AYF43710.1 hypothetical protein BALOs_0700 [Halobacteriovorax sp. BALOs_7]